MQIPLLQGKQLFSNDKGKLAAYYNTKNKKI